MAESLTLPIRPVIKQERIYCRDYESQLEEYTGYIFSDVIVFADEYGSHSENFYYGAYKKEFDEEEEEQIINRLKYDGFLEDPGSLAKFCNQHPDARLDTKEPSYGFRLDTEKYTYMMCLIPQQHKTVMHCFIKKILDSYIQKGGKK